MMEPVSAMTDDELQEASCISKLIASYVRQTLDRAGHEELDAWVNADRKNMLLFEELTDEVNQQRAKKWFDEIDERAALLAIKQKIGLIKKPVKKATIFRYALAASLLIAVAIIAERRYNKKEPDAPTIAAGQIKPGSTKATLTLDNGTLIDLTAVANGPIRKETGAVVNKKDGQLEYQSYPDPASITAYNTLTTPRGGVYMLTLSDGSQVWLNAQTTIRYPVNFGKGIRKVMIDGEAFFKVTKDRSRPFVVSFGETRQLTVLGTSFDVMNYGGEPAVKVTLEEGSVSINEKVVLNPGQEYVIDHKAGQDQVKTADLEQELGWTKGNFVFNNTPIGIIMNQLSRWYDVDISYSDPVINADFTATLSRKEDISVILKRLEKTGAIHFKIEGKKILVSR